MSKVLPISLRWFEIKFLFGLQVQTKKHDFFLIFLFIEKLSIDISEFSSVDYMSSRI